MANLKNYMTEFVLIVIAFFTWLWITTNSDVSLGTTYLQFLFGSTILLLITLLVFDKHVDVTVKKNNNSWLEEGMYGAGGWVVLLIASFFVLKFVNPATATFGAIMSSLNAANPIFANSVIVNFIAIGLLIPFTESVVWLRGAEFFGDLFHIKINNNTKTTIGFVVLVAIFSFLFLGFHATAKHLEVSALIICFIMMAVTIFLVAIRNGDLRAGIIMHVIANSVAFILLTKGTIVANFIIPVVLGVIR